MRQTAVEWLQDCLNIHFSFEQKMQFEGLFQQAKEKEYRQITNAYQSGNFDGFNKTSIDYYKETFESEEKEIEF